MEFVENEFVPTNVNLANLIKKIKDKKLNFNPYLVTAAINAEVENQLKSLIEQSFKGMNVEQLAVCFEEVEKYIKTEEERYKAFKEAQVKHTMSPKDAINETVKATTEAALSSEPTHTPSNPGVLVLDKTKKKKK